MNSSFILIDSDILIDIGRNIEIAVARLEEERGRYQTAISSVTYMELIIGCRNKTELKLLEAF